MLTLEDGLECGSWQAHRAAQNRQKGADREIPVPHHRIHACLKGSEPFPALAREGLDREALGTLELPAGEQGVEGIVSYPRKPLQLTQMKRVQADHEDVESAVRNGFPHPDCVPLSSPGSAVADPDSPGAACRGPDPGCLVASGILFQFRGYFPAMARMDALFSGRGQGPTQPDALSQRRFPKGFKR